MATYDVTGPGGTNRPSRRNPGVRVPYLVENTIDISAINGDSGTAANDVLRAIDLPAETLIINAGIEVLTASASGVTLDLGDGGDVDRYIDGLDSTSTGHGAQVANASNVGHVYGSADTLDVKVLGAQDTSGKIRVWALMCDISGSDETASNSS